MERHSPLRIDAGIDASPFLPGTVATNSNHGFEMTGDQQIEKINQDRGSIEYPLCDDDSQALFLRIRRSWTRRL